MSEELFLNVHTCKQHLKAMAEARQFKIFLFVYNRGEKKYFDPLFVLDTVNKRTTMRYVKAK